MANYLGGGGFDPQAYMMRKLMDELFKDKTPEYNLEASTMGALAGSASSEAEFQKLDKVLDEYWERNNAHGARIDSMEVKQRSDYQNRKKEFYQYKEAHNQALAMVNTDYLISPTDRENSETIRLKDNIESNVKELNSGKLTQEEEKVLWAEIKSYERQIKSSYGDGGIQNITTNDVSSWTHEKLTEELGKVNRIKDALGFAEKGYKYHMEGSPHTTLSLARDVNNYYDNLTAALGIAVETGDIPKDDILLRAIVSGDKAKVKEHTDEQQRISAKLYNTHNNNIDAYDNLLNKVMAYETKPDMFSQEFLGKAISENDTKAMEILAAIPGFGEEGFQLNYGTYANNVYAALDDEIKLRDNANKRHKAYTGKFYEETAGDLSSAMINFGKQGYSLEVVDEDDEETIEEGSLTEGDDKKTTEKEEPAPAGTYRHHSSVPAIDMTPKGQERAKRRSEKAEGEERLTLTTNIGYPETKTTPEYKKRAEVSRPIYASNKSIQKIWRRKEQGFKGKVKYKDFANSVIKKWNDMNIDNKLKYGSFDNFIHEVTMAEEKAQYEEGQGKQREIKVTASKKNTPAKELSNIYSESRYLKKSGVPFDEILKEWKSEGSPSDVHQWVLGMFPDIEASVIR